MAKQMRIMFTTPCILGPKLLSSCSALLALGLSLLWAGPGLAQDDSPAPTAQAISVQGEVVAKRRAESAWVPVTVSDNFFGGDSISVRQSGCATLRLSNNTVIRLDRQTTITLSEAQTTKNRFLDLIKGTAYFLTRTPRAFRVGTPFMNAGIEGTEFMLQVTEEQGTASLFEGQLKLENDQGSITLAPSESAVARAGTAPQRLLRLSTRDSVLWTLYYPHLALKQPSPTTPLPEWQSTIADTLQLGDYAAAQDIIQKVLAASPGNAEALAYASIISLAANRVEEAISHALKALSGGPDHPQALLALSYAYQGSFRLEEALTALQRAISQAPEASLLKAREAELLLGLGQTDDAQAAAERAVQLNPNEPRAQTMRGFAALSATDLERARVALDRGIELEPGDPLPHIGKGMLMIRQHDLAAGREELELAAILDPRNPITRSYLGRAYDEEGRTERALQQFTLAREFDPNDPTPGFYEAVALQRRGDPLAALTPLQESIKKSANRATVRSRLLLDEDYAARSAALARVYGEAGFTRLGLNESAAAVTLDPTNPAAHRFLAETFAELPRHQIAKVSELLQSRLLNRGLYAPVQPEMIENSLYIPKGSGPSSVSPEELSPLFNHEGLSLLSSGVAGNDQTLGDQLAVAGEWERISLSLAQFHFQTDGFRENADQTSDISLFDGVVRISSKTAAYAEYRNRRQDRGDLELRFEPENFSNSRRDEDDRTAGSVGLRHDLTPASVLLGSFTQNHSESSMRDDEMPVLAPFHHMIADDGHGNELRYSWRSSTAGLTAGGGYFTLDRLESVSHAFSQTATKTNLDHFNDYIYAHFLPLPCLDIIMGGSFDLFDDESEKKKNFNPKAGVSWSPHPTVTLRMAAFKTFKRTLLNDQTLEPTQVAGFNQFYDDAEATSAWRYGTGVDLRLLQGVFLGAEISRRNLQVPLPLNAPGQPTVTEEFSWQERNADAYLYWTPAPWLSLSADFHYEHFIRPEYSSDVSDVETNRLPLGARFFWRGASLTLTETHVRQEGSFMGVDGLYAPREDRFWLFDTRITYRLFRDKGILSLEGKNLLGTAFHFQDMDPENPSIQPGRSLFAKLSLMF